MIAATFDPMADASSSYLEAWRQIRLLTLLRGERWANEHDEFDIVLAADLARLPERGRERVPG